MNVLYLGPYRENMIQFLRMNGEEVHHTEQRIDHHVLNHVDFIVSYGYRHIIQKDVVHRFKHRAINLHISYLPWNRGADPNLWSFLEDTPKGVSIHYLDEGIDTGDIIIQKKVEYEEDDTLRSTYNRLSHAIEELFMEHWVDIKNGQLSPKPQKQEGTYHTLADRKKVEHLLIHGWDTPVKCLVGQSTETKREEGKL